MTQGDNLLQFFILSYRHGKIQQESQKLFIAPLDIYRMIANNYNNIVLWAANAQACRYRKSFLSIILNKNIGISMLPVVKAIEIMVSGYN